MFIDKFYMRNMKKLSILEMNRISVEEFKLAEKLPLVVVLDEVRSLHNIGSVFRSSDAFRVESIFLCGTIYTVTKNHSCCRKRSLYWVLLKF